MIDAVIKQFLAKRAAMWDPSVVKDPYFDPKYKEEAEKFQRMFRVQRVIGMVDLHTPIFEAPDPTSNEMLNEFSPEKHAKAAKVLKEKLDRMNSHAHFLHSQDKLGDLNPEFYEDIESLQDQIQCHERLAREGKREPLMRVQPIEPSKY